MAAKAQAFAHRLVEFADAPTVRKFLEERGVDLNKPNEAGWSVLMSVCACGRDDLAGYVLDLTTNVNCATVANRTTVLHLAAISPNPLVMRELLATEERREKLQSIVNTPNVNGDTPLMMACVAKSDEAVLGLIERLGADAFYGNATGMSALHCAARLSGDASMDAATRDELARRSLVIVELLLARGAAINVTELAAGNSPLHFAVMSDNIGVVNRFLEEPTLDIAIQSKAGLSALDLAKRGDVHQDIIQQLQARWESLKAEQEKQSAAAEQELLALATNEEMKIDKGKSKAGRKIKRGSTPGIASQKTTQTAADIPEKGEAPFNTSTSVKEPNQSSFAPATIDEEPNADDSSDWQSVSTKKNRRKPEAAPVKAANNPKATPRKQASLARKQDQKHLSNPPSLVRPVEAQTVAKTPSPPSRMRDPTPPAWTSTQQIKKQDDQTTRKSSPRRTEASVHSYERLNAEFQRAFPMAGELDLGVETFLIGSSSADHALQPEDGLSISQVEVLQEAHWQAYHYLNEKKLDLARVLEAQRLEAQFKLQQEILHLE